MKVVDYQPLIKQTEAELKELEKQQTKAKLLLRAQLLRVLKTGEFLQLKKVSRFLGISEKHGYDLWKKYQKEGIKGYLQLNYKANARKLSDREEAILVERSEQGFATLQEAQVYIFDQFGAKYTIQGVSDLFERLKIKKKVPRPQNIKADKEVEREYKKTSS